MADNLIITRFWQDVDFFQMQIECKTESISIQGKIYTTDDFIDDLYHKLGVFLSRKVTSICWENGIKGDGASPCIMLHFFHKDALGHVLIEVFMEIDDGGMLGSHNCCFYINTEIGLLHQFRENLLNLKTPQLGMQISLI